MTKGDLLGRATVAFAVRPANRSVETPANGIRIRHETAMAFKLAITFQIDFAVVDPL